MDDNATSKAGPLREVDYLDVVGDLVVAITSERTISYLNSAGAAILGCQSEDVVGLNWLDEFIPVAERPSEDFTLGRLAMDASDAPSFFIGSVKTRAGEERIISWRNALLRDETGRGSVVVRSGQDVTGQKTVEKELRVAYKAHSDIRRALDESALVTVTDASGTIEYVNQPFCEISGYDRVELVGRTHSKVNSGYHTKAFIEELWQTINSGRVWKNDINNVAKDGSVFWTATTIVPFLNEKGQPYQFLAIRNDITAQKRGEERLARTVRDLSEAHGRLVEEQAKLIQAEKLSSIGLLASGVAHEINNPLAGLMGCLDVLEIGKVTVERKFQYFQAMREGLQRIQGTVKGLLDYARPRPFSPSVLDVAEIVIASMKMLHSVMQEEGVGVENLIEPDSVFVAGDHSQVSQAFLNVLINALHATPRRSDVIVSSVTEADLVGIQVSDKGPGIPSQQLKVVCDPFFTTKGSGRGTGLGLSVTLAIVKAHGGELSLDSESGRGTVATIWLPRAQIEDKNAS